MSATSADPGAKSGGTKSGADSGSDGGNARGPAAMAQQIGEDAKAEVGRLRDQAVAGARHQAEEGKDAAGAYLHTVAAAVNSGAETFRRDGRDGTGALLERAAEEIVHVADRLAERRPGELYREVEGFARRHPAVFFGSAFVLAFGAARLLKSSAPASQPERIPAAAGTAPGPTSIGMPPGASAGASRTDASDWDSSTTGASSSGNSAPGASTSGSGPDAAKPTTSPGASASRPAASGPAAPAASPTPMEGSSSTGTATAGTHPPGSSIPGSPTPGSLTPGTPPPRVGTPGSRDAASRKEVP